MSKRVSRNKFRKSRKSKRNRRPKFGMTENDIYDIYGVIMIYGRDSCPACLEIKEFCNEKSIKYEFIVRDSTDEKQNSIINNSIKGYNYIPVIISSKTNKFLGGSQDFKKLVTDTK
jgi:glutaredoxin